MDTLRILEGGLVTILFLGYVVLWAVKRRTQRATTGTDPEVMYRDTRPSQRYFANLARFMTVAVVALVVLHTADVRDVPGLCYISFLDVGWVDWLGFAVGGAGLSLCWLAQRTMGNAWRVGIDRESETELVTAGVFGVIRNPTYSGLFLVCAGVMLILPTSLVLTWCLLFVVSLEFQVRQEEEHLSSVHGEAYRAYAARTKRYLPGIY